MSVLEIGWEFNTPDNWQTNSELKRSRVDRKCKCLFSRMWLFVGLAPKIETRVVSCLVFGCEVIGVGEYSRFFSLVSVGKFRVGKDLFGSGCRMESFKL